MKLTNTNGSRWALMQRRQIPDVSRPGQVYIDRLRIISTPWCGIFLHRIYTPDGDDALHDHPWTFVRVILSGGYREQRGYLNLGGELCLSAMHYVKRVSRLRSTDLHRISRLDRTPTTTLVLHGPRHKDWGFVNKLTGRWVQWERYLAGERS